MIRESVRTQYPMMFAYDGKHNFLDEAAASLATTEERIRSVWPYLTSRAIAFSKTLKLRERVSFDLEDVLAELYAALAQRDHKWSPERGKYLTFAGRVIANELCSIRDRARTVESPRNSFGRIKEYLAEEVAGTITTRRLKTLADIRRTGFGVTEITGNGRDFDKAIVDDPAGPMIANEEVDERVARLKAAMTKLAPVEAEVLIRTAGIFGATGQTISQVAKVIGRTAWEVSEIKATAMKKLRSHLTSPTRAAA